MQTEMIMSIEEEILSTITEYDSIIISRHIRPDGDAVGSSKGLAEVLKESFPEKTVLVVNDDFSEFTSFMGKEDSQVSDSVYEESLLIVVDTGDFSRISNSNASKASKIIKIDHHIDNTPFGDISLVEDFRSSCCEIIANFVKNNSETLKMTKTAASFLYTGMVTDSGRFKFAETNSDTLRTAAYLMDFGIDVQKIYDDIYLISLEEFSLKGTFYNMIRFTENSVAYIYFSLNDLNKLGITRETASNAVDLMQEIKGTDIWLVFIEQDDGKIRVRLRSRGKNVEALAGKYHGGGHLNASGATCFSKEEADNLLKDADLLHYLA